jgi:hypothetical protein
MDQVLEHRRNMVNGFGLPVKALDQRESEPVPGGAISASSWAGVSRSLACLFRIGGSEFA